MKFIQFLNEFSVITNPGDDYQEEADDYVFMFNPKFGLWYVNPEGKVYQNDKLVDNLSVEKKINHNIVYHWDLGAIIRKKLKIKKETDGTVQGRIKNNNNILIGINQSSKIEDKAIDAIYKYIKNYVKEEYIMRGRVNHRWRYSDKGDTFEMFINPTAKELKEAGNTVNDTVRYIIDFQEKNIYVWTSNVIHRDAFENLQKENKINFSGSNFFRDEGGDRFSTGVAAVKGGKLVFESSDAGCNCEWKTKEVILTSAWLKLDDKWLSRWFSSPYIKTFEKYMHNSFD